MHTTYRLYKINKCEKIYVTYRYMYTTQKKEEMFANSGY